MLKPKKYENKISRKDSLCYFQWLKLGQQLSALFYSTTTEGIENIENPNEY